MDFRNPGSQAKDGSFFGLEAALEGLEPGYTTTDTSLYHLKIIKIGDLKKKKKE